MQKRAVNVIVGLFVILGVLALLFLALRVSGLTSWGGTKQYDITAAFDNIGGLKVRAPVRIAGVAVGQVVAVHLDKNDYRARVTMAINANVALPVDTSASIFTEGLLGSNYINLNPGYEQKLLHNGGNIETTTSALVLEKLIGQFLFNAKKSAE